jgi:N-glycosidase YbiA
LVFGLVLTSFTSFSIIWQKKKFQLHFSINKDNIIIMPPKLRPKNEIILPPPKRSSPDNILPEDDDIILIIPPPKKRLYKFSELIDLRIDPMTHEPMEPMIPPRKRLSKFSELIALGIDPMTRQPIKKPKKKPSKKPKKKPSKKKKKKGVHTPSKKSAESKQDENKVKSTAKKILNFYSHSKGDFQCFSNFYTSPMTLRLFGRDMQFPTGEHAFQAGKAKTYADAKKIADATTAKNAKKLGRKIDRKLDFETKFNPSLWQADYGDQVKAFDRTKHMILKPEPLANKDFWMFVVVLEKFKQNEELSKVLRQTASWTLVEHTKNDKYWADGGSHGQGWNMLGQLLMCVRADLYSF